MVFMYRPAYIFVFRPSLKYDDHGHDSKLAYGTSERLTTVLQMVLLPMQSPDLAAMQIRSRTEHSVDKSMHLQAVK